jgi:hypothetical protein
MLLNASGAYAQRYVDIPAGFGTVNTVIAADSANRAANPNTIYRVHRGTADSVYYLTKTLTGWGSMPLRIQSTGTGSLPAFILTTLSDGSAISPMISAKADFSIKGVALNGVNTLGAIVDRVVRIQASPVRVEFDSCQVNMASQSFIRVDNTNARIFIKNCRISNVYSDWANARVIDNRGITIDTLSMTGSSVYRVAYRVYRDGGGILTYGFFNHNTFTEIADAILGLGSTKNITFTNNLAVNCGFLGRGVSSAGRLISLTPVPSGQTAYVANNVFYSDSVSLLAAYKSISDTIKTVPFFADTLTTFMNAAGTAASNIISPVSFTMAPGNIVKAIKLDSIARWYWRNPGTLDASIIKVDSIKYVNLAYNTTAPAYSYGTDKKPAGAPEWFGIVLGVEKLSGKGVPTAFTLGQNYPNPFNPSTTISYGITASSHVTLKVYDMLGKEVVTLVNEAQSAGLYRVRFDASHLSSGLYFYRLTAGSTTAAKKMLFVK